MCQIEIEIEETIYCKNYNVTMLLVNEKNVSVSFSIKDILNTNFDGISFHMTQNIAIKYIVGKTE